MVAEIQTFEKIAYKTVTQCDVDTDDQADLYSCRRAKKWCSCFACHKSNLRRFHTYTLVELSEPASCHCRAVSSVHLSYVVSFDVGDFVHGQIPGKGYLISCQRT